MKNVVVFAANECAKVREDYYLSLAYSMGKLLSDSGFTVVTGGGPGLMDAVNRGAYEAGGKSIGICLNVEGREPSKFLTSIERFDKLPPRQERLISLGNAFVALPGGIGTFSEIYEVLARKRKNELDEKSPFVLVDTDYFSEWEAGIRKMKAEGFVRDAVNSLYSLVHTPAEAVTFIKNNLTP